MNRKEFAKRRKTLMRMVGEDGIAILPSAPVKIRNRDVEYRYRQDSDFYYLSGFAEPDAVAVLAPGRDNGEYVLFCRDRDSGQELWHGSRAGPNGAVEDFAADDAFPIDDIDDILPGILESRNRVFYTMGAYAEFDRRITEWVKALRSREASGIHTPHEFIALDHILHDMRLYKSRAEISAMRKAAKIAVSAHRRAIACVTPGMFEYEVEAEYMHEFRRHDASWSYTPIVGTGANACTLHYVDNNAQLAEGDLLLIDAGCEVEGYASDITRTFPVNGKYSNAQREVYDVVLAAHQAAVKKVKPGNHWNDPHNAAVRVITRGLVELKLLKGNVTKLIKERAYRKFYMHRTGHWLGLDVHDVGDYKVGDQWRLLEPGMVMTIEPGLYIPARSRGVHRKWWDIGIRIEDDVLVTRQGYEILTDALPRKATEIEALMAS